VLLACLSANNAVALIIVCPAGKRFDSDPKPSMQMAIPLRELKAFGRLLRVYAVRKNLNYWSDYQPGYRQTRFILHSKKSSVWFGIRIADEDKIAYVFLERNCVPDEDWRPYWVDFQSFVAAGPYKRISN